MRILAALVVAIGLAIVLYPVTVNSAMHRLTYYGGLQGNYVRPPSYGHPYGRKMPMHDYRTPATNYGMPIYNYRRPPSQQRSTEFDRPWTSPKLYSRHRLTPSRPVDLSTSRSQNLRSTCMKLTNLDLEAVLMEVVRRENENRGSSRREIVKSISESDVKLCRVCTNGRCSFDHKIVEMAMTLGAACTEKSRTCVCGVNRQVCNSKKNARVDPQKRVYDLNVGCERRLSQAKVIARRRHQRAKSKARKKAKARKRKKKAKRKKTRPKKPKPTTNPKAVTETEAQEEFDISAEGPGPDPDERPAPIVEWDETTSQATVIYPEPKRNQLDNWRGMDVH